MSNWARVTLSASVWVRIPCDNWSATRISLLRGWHEAVFSDDARVFVDTFSAENTPPQVRLHEGMLDRLPGSRGQLTLSVELTGAEEAWWLFAFDDIGLDCIGSEVRLAGRQLLPG